MSKYTPINIFKVSKSGKEFLIKAKELSTFSVGKIYVDKEIFNEILESISPAIRSFYSDAIPFEGKFLVRK